MRASVTEEKLEAWKRVSVNLGSLGTDRAACGHLGSPETCRRVCEPGKSVRGPSRRALRARAGGDHLSAQLWIIFGTTWDQLGTNLGQIWDQCGNMFGTTLESEMSISAKEYH